MTFGELMSARLLAKARVNLVNLWAFGLPAFAERKSSAFPKRVSKHIRRLSRLKEQERNLVNIHRKSCCGAAEDGSTYMPEKQSFSARRERKAQRSKESFNVHQQFI